MGTYDARRRRSLKHQSPPGLSWLRYLVAGISSFALTLILLTVLAGMIAYSYIEPQLPNVETLRQARYEVPMSVYTSDGALLGQFGERLSSPVRIDEVPELVVHAFLAAEDDRFYQHPGVDYRGLLRSAALLLATGEKRQGGSTITMQVARNFFLSREKTFLRKFKEILLALKIERELSKPQILELYLNKIYFGHRQYGVEAASQFYFGKPVGKLDLSEAATLAGLPKAPSRLNPLADLQRSKARRDYVLARMAKLGFISEHDGTAAMAAPMTLASHGTGEGGNLPLHLGRHVAEMVRDQMVRWYGEAAYTTGFRVYTTLDSRLQQVARHAVREGLENWDRGRGSKTAIAHVDLDRNSSPDRWGAILRPYDVYEGIKAALIVAVEGDGVHAYLGDGNTVKLPSKLFARAADASSKRRGRQKRVAAVTPGDVVLLRTHKDGYRIARLPEVEGALVAVRAGDGAILALVGGYDFGRSKFNRATQAHRQAGSSFKPLVYAAALERGYTPASVVLDEPFSITDTSVAGGVWQPGNYSGRFYGPTRLRTALAHSRNLVSVRLAYQMGVPAIIATAQRFGLDPAQLPKGLSLALGTAELTPVEMAKVYASFANGGYRIEPYFIQRIEDLEGKVIYQTSPQSVCALCTPEPGSDTQNAPRSLSPEVHYMLYSMLQDVIRRGTATAALELGRSDLAGKTGTTNAYRDAWFNGFAPGLAAVTWIGYDDNRSLGRGATGGQVALPIWIRFMREALRDIPDQPFPVPPGIVVRAIDPHTGLRVAAGSPGAVAEYFPAHLAPPEPSVAVYGPASDDSGTAPRRAPTELPADESVRDTPMQELF